ncbi:hypothetical protein QFZ49_007033 [Streptomyces turgidiscabies]|uniref:Secreted protein n=1 Tax=Streptomyces turgidiscabies TaxID=85558 RepID=A0ABU0RYK0_9ACTN|nr:hypothetical protein [Streptomyces turgidiscabies]
MTVAGAHFFLGRKMPAFLRAWWLGLSMLNATSRARKFQTGSSGNTHFHCAGLLFAGRLRQSQGHSSMRPKADPRTPGSCPGILL